MQHKLHIMNTLLEQFLVSNIYAILMVLTRVGSGLMVLPGIGEAYVSSRSRLVLAVAIAVVIAPVITPKLPPLPASPWGLATLLIGEIYIGVALGLVCRIMISAMHVAGMTMSYQSGIAMATQFDVTQAAQGSIIGSMLSLTAIMVIFGTDLHYLMLRGLTDSYDIFTPGAYLPVEDFAGYFSRLVADMFTLGIKLAAPAIVVGLLLYLGAGVLARLMPNMQVFFVLMPPQIYLGFFILMAVYISIMFEFTEFFTENLEEFLREF
jgi:flagellar biosynthetic protein FliR